MKSKKRKPFPFFHFRQEKNNVALADGVVVIVSVLTMVAIGIVVTVLWRLRSGCKQTYKGLDILNLGKMDD